MNTPAVLNNGNTFGGALGQFVTPYKGLNQIQHSGGDAGYRSYLARFPDQNFAIAVASNLGNFNPNQKALQVADIFLEEFQKTENSEAPVSVVQKRDYIKLKNKQLKKFEGRFWNEAGSYSRRIYLKNDTLRYNRGGDNESLIVPIAENEFQMLITTADLLVKFESDSEQKTMVVTIDGGEPIISKGYEPIKYSKEVLAEFEGTFYSEELGTSYTFEAKDDHLIAKHIRNSEFILRPIKGDRFSANRWFFSIVEFVRNPEGKITDILVSSGRIRNLRFEKQ